MDTIQIWVSHYGYFGIFSLLFLGIVGIPIPDETLLALSGYLVYKGDLSMAPTFLSAFLGSMTGISISYAIGTTFGHYVLIKYGHFIRITEDRLQRAHNWFERTGRWALLVGYFIPGVRHVVAILAGTSELQLWEFALFASGGAFLWTSTFILIGYLFGDKWELILSHLHEHLWLVSSIIVVVLFFSLLYRKKRKNGKPKVD